MFLIVHLHQDGSLACGHLALLVSLLEVVAMLSRGGFFSISMCCFPPAHTHLSVKSVVKYVLRLDTRSMSLNSIYPVNYLPK